MLINTIIKNLIVALIAIESVLNIQWTVRKLNSGLITNINEVTNVTVLQDQIGGYQLEAQLILTIYPEHLCGFVQLVDFWNIVLILLWKIYQFGMNSTMKIHPSGKVSPWKYYII